MSVPEWKQFDLSRGGCFCCKSPTASRYGPAYEVILLCHRTYIQNRINHSEIVLLVQFLFLKRFWYLFWKHKHSIFKIEPITKVHNKIRLIDFPTFYSLGNIDFCWSPKLFSIDQIIHKIPNYLWNLKLKLFLVHSFRNFFRFKFCLSLKNG